MCRRRLDGLNWPWRREPPTRYEQTGSDWSLVTPSLKRSHDVLTFSSNERIGVLPKARKLVERLTERFNDRRRKVVVPAWPEGAPLETARVAQVLAGWRVEWDRLRTRRLWRCESPHCAVAGGRYFELDTPNGKDCKYCRRLGSKWARSRERAAAHQVER